MTTCIHWFRRDLRIRDNTALNTAAGYDAVVPVYIVSEWKRAHHWCGAAKQEFLCGSLLALHRNLESRGGRLIIGTGSPEIVLESLARETGATVITFNRDPDPYVSCSGASCSGAGCRTGDVSVMPSESRRQASDPAKVPVWF